MPIGVGDYDTSVVEPIELRMIKPSKFPVRYADQKDSPGMASLRESIREHGLLQPILVRPLEHGFEIVAGHRRFAACRSLRHRFISCRICEFSDRQAYEIQLTENLQRKTMDPIEEAEAYQKYVFDFGWGGVRDLSRKIGKSEEYVSHRMQLLKLPDGVKNHVITKSMSVSQALELVGMPGPSEEMAEDIVQNKLTIRSIRKMKAQLSVESGTVARRRRESKSKESQITSRGVLTLKITLSRIDDLIESAHGVDPKERAAIIEFLMDMRRRVHSMIDDVIRFEKSRPKR